eukprot:SAG11_NODE_856_length_6864_cov_12.741168_8_plen_94_part_00
MRTGSCCGLLIRLATIRQVFDAEVDKSLKLLAAKIKEMDTSAVLRNEVLESKTDGLISNLQVKQPSHATLQAGYPRFRNLVAAAHVYAIYVAR